MAVDDAGRRLLGDLNQIKTRVETWTNLRELKSPPLTAAQQAANLVYVTLASQVIEGCFQQSILFSKGDVVKVLGYFSTLLYDAKQSGRGAFGQFSGASQQQPAQLCVTLPKAKTILQLTFIKTTPKTDLSGRPLQPAYGDPGDTGSD